MIVIPPMTIDSSNLSYTSINEPDGSEATAWITGTNYSLGTVVYLASTHKKYQCISPGVSTVSPDINIYSATPQWTEIGATNRYAMFDLYRNTRSTTTSGNITAIVVPSYRIDTIAVLDLLNVTSVTVTVRQGTAVTVFTTAISSPTSSIVCTNIPPFYNTTVTVSVSGPTATTVGVGAVVIGLQEDLGTLQNGITIDTINTSTVSRDIYGNAILLQKRNIPKINCTTLIDSSATSRILDVRDKLNAVPCVWVGLENKASDEYFEPTIIVGFYRSFSVSLDNPIASTVSLELEEI